MMRKFLFIFILLITSCSQNRRIGGLVDLYDYGARDYTHTRKDKIYIAYKKRITDRLDVSFRFMDIKSPSDIIIFTLEQDKNYHSEQRNQYYKFAFLCPVFRYTGEELKSMIEAKGEKMKVIFYLDENGLKPFYYRDKGDLFSQDKPKHHKYNLKCNNDLKKYYNEDDYILFNPSADSRPTSLIGGFIFDVFYITALLFPLWIWFVI